MISLRFSSYKVVDWYVKVTLEQLKMPKYAVAVGRKVGIYDTYDECKLQVINYPNAKFKKFDTTQAAEAFIRQFSRGLFNENCGKSVSMVQVTNENTNKPELIKLEKVSPRSDLFAITNRVSSIEEKLNNFITTTSTLLENLATRIKKLESNNLVAKDKNSVVSCGPSYEPPLKKQKTDGKPCIDRLIISSDGYTPVYTDGACSKNGRMGAQAGIGVWFGENSPLNISAPVQGPATNNNAEIQAARVAITQAHHAGIRKLTVYTDSKFVINCITQWIHKWKKNEWTLASGGPVKNKDEIIKLDDAIQLLEAVEWNYVAGHKGVRGNEMADKLARDGAKKYKTNVTYSRNAELETVKFFGSDSDEDFKNVQD